MSNLKNVVEAKNSILKLRSLASKEVTESSAMPKTVYISEEVLALEKELIFTKEWLCAGTEAEIPNKGDYLTFEIGKQPIFVVRNLNNEINAFSNVCLHRMMPLVAGKGNKKLLTCPYHAWSYNLDGELKACPYMDQTKHFSKKDFRLPKIKCEVFMGWIYVSLNNEIDPVALRLEELRKIAAPYNMEKYINIISEDFEWQTNWKLLTENFMEGYHLPVAHPGTVGPYFNVLDTKFDERGAFDCFTYQFFTKKPGSPVGTAHIGNKSLKGKWRYTSILPTIFPSHMYSLAPDHYWYLSIQPNGVEKVMIRFGAAIAPEVYEEKKNEESYLFETKKFLYEVQEEDRFVVEALFKGVSSPLGKPGPLSWLERENHEFTQYLARKLSPIIYKE